MSAQASEPNNKPEQVLEVCESPRTWRREVFADLVASNHLAEAVAEIQLPCEAKVYSHMRTENGPGGRKLCRRNYGVTPGHKPITRTSQMNKAASGTEVRPDPATPASKVD